ncbi:MAG: GNAT family N-acetyltransferase [Planctomycetota bacterium]|jgi:hypothetical protein
MQIRRVDTEKAGDVRSFVAFPFDLYRVDSLWVPPFVSDAEKILDRKAHPFYRRADADFFLAESGGKVVGRIAVAKDETFKGEDGKAAAFFHYFEVTEDLEAAQGLFEAAFDWGRKRNLTSIVGPLPFVSGDGLGFLIEGFDFAPPMGIPYNPPYYARFAEQAGLAKRHDYLSGHLHGDVEFPPRVAEIAKKVQQRRGFRIQGFEKKKEIRKWIPRIAEVYNRAFAGGTGFSPLGEAEALAFADRILPLADPELIKLVMKGETVVGFILAYPNVNEALKKAGGKLWPFGWFRILRAAKRSRWVDINGVGLLPEFQGRGANAVLYAALAKALVEFGFEHANVVQINEADVKIAGDMKALGVAWRIRHRVYKRALT